MPAREIRELRESGMLEEALNMALSEFNADPENIWTKRNLAWVYYTILKQEQGNQEPFIAILNKIIALNVPENENMFYEQFCWVLGAHNFKISKSTLNSAVKFSSANLIFNSIKTLNIQQSKGFSFLLKSFHHAFKETPNNGQFNPDNFLNTSKSYDELFQWAGFNSFLMEDFEPYEMKGKMIMSFVEQVIIAYAKVLLKGERIEGKGFTPSQINVNKVPVFLEFLEVIIKEHPEFQYTLYYKSKILLAVNKFEDAKKALIPFVKKKKNDFWVWDLLAEAYPDDVDIQMGCICKALTLNTKESFLVKVHQKLATLLIAKKLNKEASIEVLNAIQIRKKNNWKISNEFIKHTQEQWFIKDVRSNDNKNFYLEQAVLAEELLYNNHNEFDIVVSFVNENKKMISFVKDKTVHGFFSYKHLKINPKIGDLLSIRANKIGEEGVYKILTIKPSLAASSEALKVISGTFKEVLNKDYGFINGIFIAPDIKKENNLLDNTQIKCKAMLSFNKKKDEWGWRVFEVIK